MSEKKLTLMDLVPVTAPVLTPEWEADMSKYLMDTTQVVHRQIQDGSVTIECEYDEVYSAPQVVSLAVAESNGVDGVFVNCFGDPGVRAVREKLKVPVFGGFEPAIYLGLGLGDTLGIVTVLKNVVPMICGAIARAGLERRVVSVRTLDLPVLELQDREKLTEIRRKIDRQLVDNELHALNAFAVEALIAAYNEGGEWLDELKKYLWENYEYLRDFFTRHLPALPVTPLEATYLV